jgi:hypothetical protein
MSAHLELTEELIEVVLYLATIHVAWLMYDITNIEEHKRTEEKYAKEYEEGLQLLQKRENSARNQRKIIATETELIKWKKYVNQSQERLNGLLHQKENIDHYITYKILPYLCSRGCGEHAEIFILSTFYGEVPVWRQKDGMRIDPCWGCDGVDDLYKIRRIDEHLARQPSPTEEQRQKAREQITREIQKRKGTLSQLSPSGEVKIAGLYELCDDEFYAINSRIYLLQKLELKLAKGLPEELAELRSSQHSELKRRQKAERERLGLTCS